MLMKTFSMDEVTVATQQALQITTIAFDAVKHLLLCAIEPRSPKLDLENYPHRLAAEVLLTQVPMHPP
jgi:hypothetical protein